jgi:hypothetical protein
MSHKFITHVKYTQFFLLLSTLRTWNWSGWFNCMSRLNSSDSCEARLNIPDSRGSPHLVWGHRNKVGTEITREKTWYNMYLEWLKRISESCASCQGCVEGNFSLVLRILGQSAPAHTNAPVGHSVHGMGCIFCPDSISQLFLNFDQWVFLGLFFFLNPDPHTTFPPNYPTDLATLLTYILTLLIN